MDQSDYFSLSDVELTELFSQECPEAWFPVREHNRQTAIACIKILRDLNGPSTDERPLIP